MQIRCLYEGVGVDEMLNGWDHLLPTAMNKWKLDRSKVGVRYHCQSELLASIELGQLLETCRKR